mgnify:CR=1 FL=1
MERPIAPPPNPDKLATKRIVAKVRAGLPSATGLGIALVIILGIAGSL